MQLTACCPRRSCRKWSAIAQDGFSHTSSMDCWSETMWSLLWMVCNWLGGTATEASCWHREHFLNSQVMPNSCWKAASQNWVGQWESGKSWQLCNSNKIVAIYMFRIHTKIQITLYRVQTHPSHRLIVVFTGGKRREIKTLNLEMYPSQQMVTTVSLAKYDWCEVSKTPTARLLVKGN